MISNNSSSKLKASKSTRDSESEVQEDSSASRTGGLNDPRYRSIFVPKDGRVKPRGRNPTDFRGYRGLPAERRGASRPRGVFYGKSDRDTLDSSYRRPPDPVPKQAGNESLPNYNYTQDSKAGFLYNLPEDPRISKLVRRLCGEADVEKSLAICMKLHEAILLGENVRYIRRSYDILGESLIDVLYEAPSQEVRLQVAEAIARIGYVMASVRDFKKHQDWVLSRYNTEQNQEVKAMLMLSLHNLFKLDFECPSLDEYVPDMISQLQAIIEATDSARIFTVTIDTILILSKSYPEVFAKNFIDMVDILVGWHVDVSQPVKIKEFALNTLGEFTNLWRADLVFSVRLLNQFLEDMVAYGDDLVIVTSGKSTDSEDVPTSPEECIQHITSLMNVFNTVIKSLGTLLNPNVSPTISYNYLTESFLKMLKIYLQAIGMTADNDLVTAGNESVYLFLDLLHAKASSNFVQLYDLIKQQLEISLELTDKSLISFLNLLRKVIKEISGNLPLEFITTIIGKDSNILQLRTTRTRIIQETVMSVFQSLLNLKNIPLLQDAYRYVLEDLEVAYEVFVPCAEIHSMENEIYNKTDAEQIILFNLQCLMDIANASNSIIGMWALQPSILELLAVKLKPHDQRLSTENPLIQFSVLYLLYSHCKKNNHFIASSDLVSFGQSRAVCDIFGISKMTLGDVSNSSPTSAHFGIILTLFNKLFKCKLQTDTLLLLLKWTEDVFYQLQKFHPTVFKTSLLVELVMNTIEVGFTTNKRIIDSVATNLEILVKDNSITWNYFLMYRLGNLCLMHQKSNRQSIQKTYSHIATYVPWDIIILDLIKPSDVKSEKYRSSKIIVLSKSNIVSAQKEHLMRDACGQMTLHHFKTFMNYLLNNFPYKDGWLRDAFIHCWPLQNADSNINHLTFYRHCALQFSSVLTTWSSWEAARFCVTSKLRTSLGKPQETFTSIESAIKHLARLLSQKITNSSGKIDSDKQAVTELARSRMLIEFLEHLEKAIYNAAEGCGMVLVPVVPTVKTFFHTNSLTCREWLSRVRPAALLVGLHTGHASVVVRHTHSLLMSFVNTNPSTTSSVPPEVLSYCISLTRALLLLQEPEALIGLYTWVKKLFNVKLHWIKAAAEQSSMKYEAAVESYYLTLTNQLVEEQEASTETCKNLENGEKDFINEQIIECYKHIQNWTELIKWKDTLNDTKISNEMSNFNENILEDFCDWDKLLTRECESSENWTCSNILNSNESTLKNIAVNILYEREDLTNCTTSVEKSFNTLQSTLHELTRNEPCEHLTNTHILYYAASALRTMVVDRKLKDNPLFVSSHLATLKNVSPSTLGKIVWWFEYFSKINPSQNDVNCLETMRLDLVKSHRKVYNHNSAKRELIKYFSTSKNHILTELNISQLEDIYNVFVQPPGSYDMNVWNVSNVTAIIETSKLLYVNEETKEMAISLCASASLGVSQRLTLGEHSYELRETGTKMLLTLSKWVQNESDKLLINNLNSPLTKLVTALPEIGLVNNNVSANVIPILDSAVGKLLQFSVNQCPGLAKAWFTFGSWCFRWGRKMVEYSSNTGGQLTQNDKQQVQNIMAHGTPEDFDTVCEILSKTRVSCDDEDIDWNEINTSEMIESQLRSIPSLRNAYPEHLVLLVDIWRQAQKRVFSYYELSADAYFKFLDLSSSSEKVNHNGECAIVIATLRLLRLIVKHAMELQNVLESGLANTPTHPWKVIIPQLFSRLNHPENYVRRRVSELLCRLAEDTPHLITFPAVVGAVENKKINLADISFPKSIFSDAVSVEQENDDESDDNNSESETPKDNDLNSCFLDMVETLSKQAPETILQVQLLVKELRRINLLWDELWLGTLAQHHSEISKRLNQLEIEIAKVKNNSTLDKDEKERLIKEKNRIIMKPILFVLEQLAEITSATPETPHEQYFQDKFLDAINSMLDKLRNPAEPNKPQESWLPIKELQFKLQQRCSKKSSYSLRMSDISPTLSKMNDTVISMPGVHTSTTVRVTIKSIHNSVAILPTKTKPKKLVFHGSDGKIYTYLFKGLEDLHLDERIMQFLSIINTMLAHDREDDNDQTYRARHYSVIPLGPRSGLISWVDNLTPLFALYKRWQQREATILTAKNNKFVNVLRLSEMFYNKLTPLLNSAGVSIENRKEWPVSILKKVLTELMAETPKDLLSKELWCGSVTPGQWWRTVRRYSFSVAVMSAIGYIIGLGDRHLDNVLVDLSTGEVVHIDYNVCFEKGKTLRVPEKVPFRMTPNLEHALGVTGVEGIFRLTCEHVLKTAKRGRETLLTLLEAFVYDPLVEWGGGGTATAGAGGSAVAHAGTGGSNSEIRGKRARLERKCAKDMLFVRIAEIRHDWNENRDEISKQIAVTSSDVQEWTEHLQTVLVAEGNLQHNHRQMALVKELEALGSKLSEHPLFAVSQRYTAYKQMKDAFEESAKSLHDLLQDCNKKIENYTIALDTIKGPQLSQWIQELNFPIEHDGHLVFDLIREFLMNAGQSGMITQCEQSETELGQVARQQTLLIKSCLDLLSQYSAVVQYYPQSFLEKHRLVLYRKWTSVLLDTDSPDVCRDVLTQIQNFLSSENLNNPVTQQLIAFSYQIQTLHNEASGKLKKLFDKIQAEGGKDALIRCENNLTEARNCIRNFILHENGSDKALECMTITVLCTLNRRYLMLESGAQSAGESLVDLTSRDGEWFFDDMCMISSLVNEFVTLIPPHHNSSTMNDDRIPIALDCLKAAQSIFVDLQELSYNFQMIILPEAVKKIQCEDPSVLLMINELNTLVLNTPCPLTELLGQLEIHLRYVIMEMESPAANSLVIAADLQARYEAIVHGSPLDSPSLIQSPGRMLLMGSDGLFKPLMGRGAAIVDAINGLNIPHVWKKVDHIGEAKDLAAPLHSEQLRTTLDYIFLIKRIQTLTDFFGLCVQMSCAFKGVAVPVVYDDDRLFKPIKRFIADYIGRQFLGVQSQSLSTTICLLLQRLGLNVNMEIEQRDIGVSWKVPLEELIEICISNSVKSGMLSASSLQQATTLNANLDTALRRCETIRSLERAINMATSNATRLGLQSTAHSWLRSEGRPAGTVPATGSPTTIPPTAELKKLGQQLSALQPKLAVVLEKHRALVTSAEQRLKWASGANPALNEVMAAFECAVNIREDRLNVERSLAQSIANVCSALGIVGEQGPCRGLPALAQKRRNALTLMGRAPPPPPQLYESLLQLLSPESGIDTHWVSSVSSVLKDMINQLQSQIVDLKNKLSSSHEVVKNSVNKLSNLKNIHEKLVYDAKGLLKSISKYQENSMEKLQDYLIAHESYMIDMAKVIDSLSAENITEQDAMMAIELSEKLEEETNHIYNELISFEEGWQGEDAAVGKRRGTLVRQAAGIWSSPARQTPPRSRIIQQQNSYAASVWKRVRLKLEGRDPDPARKYNNQQQVDYIIKEAMSLENLCLLYEGWTPWV